MDKNKKTKNKAKLYFALGGVAILTVAVVSYLYTQKVSVDFPLGEASSRKSANLRTSSNGNLPSPSSLFKGSGLWTTNGSVGNENIKNSVFDWYVVSGNNLDKGYIKDIVATGKPIILNYTGKSESGVVKLVDTYKDNEQIVGIVWDYENRKGDNAAGPSAAIKDYANKNGKLLGHVAADSPNNTSDITRIDYRDTSVSDFLMPLLYCQWKSWNYCGSTGLPQRQWSKWTGTSITIIPVVAIETTGEKSGGIITPDQLTTLYGIFSPKPAAFAYWNPTNLNSGHLSAISSIEGNLYTSLSLKVDQGKCDLAKGKGRVKFSPYSAFVSCTTNCTQIYNKGTKVNLEAAVDGEGCVFDHWSVEGKNNSEKTYAISLNNDYSVTAVFRKNYDNDVFEIMKSTVAPAKKCLTQETDPNRRLSAMTSDDNGNFSPICSVGSGYPKWADMTTEIGWMVRGLIPSRLNRQQLMEVPGKNVQGWYWCTVGKQYSSHPVEPNSCGYYVDGVVDDGSGDGNASCGGDRTTGSFCYALQNKDKFIWCTEKGCQKEGF